MSSAKDGSEAKRVGPSFLKLYLLAMFSFFLPLAQRSLSLFVEGTLRGISTQSIAILTLGILEGGLNRLSKFIYSSVSQAKRSILRKAEKYLIHDQIEITDRLPDLNSSPLLAKVEPLPRFQSLGIVH